MANLSVCHSFATADHGLILTEGTGDLSLFLGQCAGCCFFPFLLVDHFLSYWHLILGGLSLAAIDILSRIILSIEDHPCISGCPAPCSLFTRTQECHSVGNNQNCIHTLQVCGSEANPSPLLPFPSWLRTSALFSEEIEQLCVI